MHVKQCVAAIAVFAALCGCSSSNVISDNPWGKVTSAGGAVSEPVGSYSAGCLKGAVSLPPDGVGFEVMHPSRRRYYGHPELIAFLQTLGKTVSERKLGVLLLGDLGQPRGGPMPSGHASHQIGLDVDIWYWQPPFATERPLTLDERENLSSVNMLSTGLWEKRNTEILKIASENSDVERIFVNPSIKRDLCASQTDHSWLRKLRPWWGHDDHFHVRLRCPDGSMSCIKQEVVAEGDGCGKDLDWWFTDEAQLKGKENAAPRTLPKLPDACAEVLTYR